MRKKFVQKCLFLSLVKRTTPPPLVNDNEQGPPGEGGREKLITFLLRGKMIFCYRVNRFLTVSLLSEIFNKTPIFKEKIVPKNAISGPNSPPTPPPPSRCPVPVQVFVRSQTNATVSSLILSTNYTQSMREGFFGPFLILLNPYRHSFLINYPRSPSE